jgi:hypothetical protein
MEGRPLEESLKLLADAMPGDDDVTFQRRDNAVNFKRSDVVSLTSRSWRAASFAFD